MAENLFLEDYITLGVYFCIVLAVGLWVAQQILLAFLI